MSKPILFKGKKIGEVEGETYTTHRKPEHFFRKFQVFGFSEKLLYYLVASGITNIKIIYHGKKMYTYRTTIAEVFGCGQVHHDGNDKQFIMPVNEMVGGE